MSAAPLVLVDLSSLAHPLFHLSGSEHDPNWTSIQIVSRVRALASGQPHVVICCDSGRSFRADIDPTYKANRPESDATLHHQIALAVETLKGDGFPVWAVRGFEADDLIASAAKAALESDADGIAHSVLIVSADKDLLQLVGPRVSQLRPALGSSPQTTYDAATVLAKFGVTPAQLGDYLALVGDSSDNIKGAKGIGPKRAAELLTKHGTLAAIMATGGDGMTPAVRDSLVEFSSRCDMVRSLVALRTDVPVDIATAFAPRVAPDAPQGAMLTEMETASEAHTDAPKGGGREPENGVDRAVETASVASQRIEAEGLPRREAVMPQLLAPAPAAWEMQLEPRSMAEAWTLAQHLHQSRLFSAYGTPSAVLSTILAGRELGLQAMASLRAFHIIEGRPTLSAGIIQAMVVKSSACEYFRCTERTNERATFETKRRDNPPVTLTFTMEDAKLAWSKGEDAFKKSGYGKNPADMLVARCATKLGRLVYPDVVSNLYSPEEMQ